MAIALVNGVGRAVGALAVAVPVSRLDARTETHIVRALREVRQQFREPAE